MLTYCRLSTWSFGRKSQNTWRPVKWVASLMHSQETLFLLIWACRPDTTPTKPLHCFLQPLKRNSEVIIQITTQQLSLLTVNYSWTIFSLNAIYLAVKLTTKSVQLVCGSRFETVSSQIRSLDYHQRDQCVLKVVMWCYYRPFSNIPFNSAILNITYSCAPTRRDSGGNCAQNCTVRYTFTQLLGSFDTYHSC
jgi:hypothetical protein